MTKCRNCVKVNRPPRYKIDDITLNENEGCTEIKASCTDAFPYPFTEFPIYILAGTSYLEAYQWKDIFPEAILVADFEQIKINLSNLGPNGALVINATSKTAVCRDLFLNTLTAAINMFRIRKYRGFYIDDYFDPFPNKTTISELTPRQSINIASLVRIDPALRSYWIQDFSQEFLLEGQLYPQLVNHIVLHSTEPPINNFGFFIAFIFIFFAFIYWLCILVWY